MIARRNPFRSERLDRIPYRPTQFSWEQMLQRLEQFGYRAAIVGGHGSGKTTLLEALAVQLSGSGFAVRRFFLTEETKQRFHYHPRSLAGQMVVFDGADLLSRADWLTFCGNSKSARGIIITSHGEGLLPTLIECDTSLQLLEDIVRELTGRPNEYPLENLLRQHRGNLRDVLRALYDLSAGQ